MSDVKICPTCGSEYPMSERFCPRDGSALKGQNAQGDLVGSMIAQSYHVIKKLGEGGMGAVYLAEHVKMGRKSAIKVMNPGMNQDPDAIARFNREAANASRMNHPNICAIYDFGETAEGVIYLAMEFIEGQSLTSLIEKTGTLPPARAASILHQTADGLQVAHDYGIVHRDLKPDNIMIARGRDNSDLVKVVDFGIAKASSSEAQKVTKTGLVVGTPEYMSPEQLAGDKLDGRSDIYSLALVGFNMLTGVLPFPSNSAQEAMIMRLTDKPRSLAEMKPNVAWPEELQRVMDKALARDVNERYQKASDFGREFSMAIEAMPQTVAAEGATMVIGAAASAKTAPISAVPKTRVATPGESGKAVPASTPTKSSMGMFAGIGGGVLAVGVAVLFMTGVLGNKNDANTTTPPPAGTPDTGHGDPNAGKQIPVDPNQGKASPGGGGTRTENPRGRGGGQPAGGGGGAPPTGGETTISAADLQQLDTWTGTGMDDISAQRAVKSADDLLKRAQGEQKVEVLLRRAVAKIQLKDDTACRDLTAARDATSATSKLLRTIDFYISNESCK